MRTRYGSWIEGAGARRQPAAAIVAVVAILAGLVVGFPGQEPAGAATLPNGFTSTPVFTGLNMPTAMAFSPDGKVYVAEKRGVIKVFPSTSSNAGVVFKDLSLRVFDFWDRGLLGLTVDPRLGDGSGHDFVYALYATDAPPGQTPPVWGDDCPTPPGGETDGCVVGGTLSRIPVLANGTAGSEQILIEDEWCQQFTSHSVGDLEFGRDGYLYVSGGEGASWANADWGQFGGSTPSSPTPENPCGDPPGGSGEANTFPTGRGGALRSQSPRRPAGEPRVLSGSVLRVDPATGDGVPGNPGYSAGSPAANQSRILAHGMRNPFRITMRPGTDEVWIGDVGQSTYEEINRVATNTPAKMSNFGWPCLEGDVRNGGYRDLDMCKSLYADGTNPASDAYYRYEHDVHVSAADTCGYAEGSSTAGIAFYDGDTYPASYSGALFVADSSRNCIWVMSPKSNGLPDPTTVRTFLDDSANPYPVDLATDPVSGDVFYVNIAFGTVNRISYTSSNRPPVAAASATPTSGNAPLSVQLSATGSSDPDGDVLAYSWDVDGNGSFGDATGVSPTVSYSTAGTWTARVMVTDPGGLSATSSGVTVTVANPSAPANTTAPSISGTPRVGSLLTATNGTWNGTGITYTRQWQRCVPGAGGACTDLGATGTTYTPQLADEGSTIRVRVTATSSGGSATVASATVGPITSGSNTPPSPVIDTPSTSTKWSANDSISFSGHATDAQDGTVPAAKLAWEIVIGHCSDSGCHEHPLANRNGVASGTIAAPEHQAPSFIELTLTATDAAGATATAVRRIDPRTVDMTFRTDPPGLSLVVGPDGDGPAPIAQSWVVNSQVQAAAPPSQVVDGTEYRFVSWSDGGAATHVITAPSLDTTYTATYEIVPPGAGGGAFVGITPNRVLDTRRPGEGPCLSGARDVWVAPSTGVPSNAVAVALNVTATGARAPGYLTVHPTGSGRPTASNLNYEPGATVPNLVTTKVGLGGGVRVFASGGCPDVVVDVAGYYTAGAVGPGGFVGVTPHRILDTRDVLQAPCVSGSPRQIVVSPRALAGVPAGAAAVTLNVTATEAAGPGYLTVYPAGSARPTASNVNYVAERPSSNHVTARVGAGGEVAIHASGGCPNVVVDVTGYFQAGTATPGGFVGITPSRVLDTRRPGEGPCLGGSRQLTVSPSAGVPPGAGAVVLNVTAVDPRAQGYLTVHPSGVARPVASNVNYRVGQRVPNAVVTGVTGGKVTLYASGGCPDVVVDVVGYHVASP